MRISFNINFFTVWGQSLYITGSIAELGNWDTSSAARMEYTGEGNWHFELELPGEEISFEYRYLVISNNELIFEEWKRNHRLNINDTGHRYVLMDNWQNRPTNLPFYSSAFTKSLFAHPYKKSQKINATKNKNKLIIKLLAPCVEKNQTVVMSGNHEKTGNWDIRKALPMTCENFPEWQIIIDPADLNFPLEYKFCIINKEDSSVLRWEKGENRLFSVNSLNLNDIIIVSGLFFNDEFPQWKGAGLAIPVFSLRSKSSFGIGDFGDLHKMVDWVKLNGQTIIQILPVNDTTMTHSWMDSYPYNAVSVYALHPLYLNTGEMGNLKDKQRKEYFKKQQKRLNTYPAVDYEEVSQIKQEYYNAIFEQEGEIVLASEAFADFFQANRDWLIPYAAYSYLRDQMGTPDFHQWKEYAHYNLSKIDKLCRKGSPSYQTVAFHYFLQFHLHQQLLKVKDYCHSNGIVLKGDIPIGISNVSVDAWVSPDYFNLDFQAGAPPDDFSLTGQNWGFPTYNWKAMEADNYQWWKKRFIKMSDYFDAYRIDHLLGFFRIWEIPYQSIEGLLGYFNPAHPFSLEEIENAGFIFKKELFTKASIQEQNLSGLFGEYTTEVQQIYLDRINASRFTIKSSWNTQRKIQAYFAGKQDEKNKKIGAGLFAICNEVLFIEDKEKPDHYHPRISAESSYIYKEQNNQDKYAFDYLYRDYFYRRQNELWKEQAYKHLIPLIDCTEMLVCGEDLGMIPPSVPEVMHQLQLLSLEIERMPKSPSEEFTSLNRNPYLSVCTPSTHDMSTIRGWWKENKEKTQKYYNEVLHQEGQAPEDCTPEISTQIISNHLKSSSMLCIIPFQDWLSIDECLRNPDIDAERINIPAHSRHYWRYRMHVSIEELLKSGELNDKIKNLVALRYS